MKEFTLEEIIEAVEIQPRLQHIVYCLYMGKDYRLIDLKSLDLKNREIAKEIIWNIFPDEIFYDIHRFK